jgi:hypothetical protein
MNRIFFLLLIVCSVLSCAGPAEQQDAVAKDSLALDEPSPELPADFKTLDTALSFAGFWVNETYIDNIRKTKSPLRSQEVEESCIIIPSRTLQITRMIAGFHEGAEDMVIVKDHDMYKLYDAGLTNLRRELEIISPSRIRIGDQYFSRLAHYDTTVQNFGILEELLFNGRYERENKGEVVFTVDGRVQGLDSFARYSPVIDYTDGSLVEFDLVNMGTGRNKGQEYGYRFNGDTLHIFRTTCATGNSEGRYCDSIVAGPALYKLVRKKS